MLFAGVNWTDEESRCEDFHKCAYNINSLSQILLENNILIEKYEFDQIDNLLKTNPRSHNLNLMVWGRKL